jgi:membrane fusion protein, multidrug efflux system
MRRTVAITVLALSVAAGAGVLFIRSQSRPASAAPAVAIGTARVQRTDIVQRQRVNGTLNYGGAVTISAPGGASAEQVQQARAALSTAQAGLNAAAAAAGDTAAANQLAIAQAQGAAAVAAAQQHAQQAQHQADAQVASARVSLQNASAALQLAQASARLDGSLTWLPSPGATVSQGQPLYAVNGRPVMLLYGAQPAYRQLCPGVSGEDVRQLEKDLIDLHFADSSSLTVDGNFSGADQGAVQRWQAAAGLPQTGVVRLGEVVFAPGPVRVAAVRAAMGVVAAPATPVLDVTATRHTVTAQIDVSRQQLVSQGNAVSVLMPDGHTNVAGTVAEVSRVATMPQGQPGQGGGPNQIPTIALTIDLADQAAAGTLDQAPVYVSITAASRKNVLAVPVTALLAQPDGGYAVAVRSGSSRHLVTIQPGLYGDNGLVEVSGAGLLDGQDVEVPAR